MATADQIQVLYITYFGRPADPQGLNYWVQNGASQQLIADGFATTPEYADTTAGKSITQVINSFYINLFGRNGDTAGVAFWTQKVNDYLLGKPGGISLQQVGRFIADGALIQPAGSPDRVALESKIEAADQWTTTVASNVVSSNNYNGAAANAVGVQYLIPVVSAATIPTQAQTDAAIALLPAAGAFTLTTSPDTATAQVFLAPQAYTPGGTDLVNTLQNEDRLTGDSVGGPTSLTADIGNNNDNGGTIIAPEVNNVDTINVAFTATNSPQTLDFQDISGTETANITRISGNLRQSFRNLKAEVSTLGIANTSEQARVDITYLNSQLSSATNAVTLNLNNASLSADTVDGGDSALRIQATQALGADLQNQIETYNINSVGSASTIATFETGVSSFDDLVVGERPVDININATASLAIGTLRWLGNRVETNSANPFQVIAQHQVGTRGLGFVNFNQIQDVTVGGTANVSLANVGTWETEVDDDPFVDVTLNASGLTTGDLTADITKAASSIDAVITGGAASDRFYVANSDVLAQVSGGGAVDSLTVQSNASGRNINLLDGSAGIENLNLVQAFNSTAQTWTVDLADGGFQSVNINNQDAAHAATVNITALNGQSLSVRSTGLNGVGDSATTAQAAVNINFTQAATVTGGTINLSLGNATDDRAITDAFSFQNYTSNVSIIDNGAQGTTEAASLNLVVNTAGLNGTGAANITVDQGDFETQTTLTSQIAATNTVNIGFQVAANSSDYGTPVTTNALNSTTYVGGAYLGSQNVTFGGATAKSHNITTGIAADTIDLSYLTTNASRTAAGFATSSNLLNTTINGGGGTDQLILSATLADPRVVLVPDPTYDGYFQNWSGIETLTINNRNGLGLTADSAYVALDAFAQANNSDLSTINFNDVGGSLTVGFRFTNDLTVNVDAVDAATKFTTIDTFSLADLVLNIDASGTGTQDINFDSTGANLDNTVNVFYNNIESIPQVDGTNLTVTVGSLDLVGFNSAAGGISSALTVVADQSWTAANQTTTYDFGGETTPDGGVFSDGTLRLLTFNASNETDASGLTIFGSTDGTSNGINNIITGSAGADTINSAGFEDQITAGLGNDVIAYTGNSGVATNNGAIINAGAGNDSVTLLVMEAGETTVTDLGAGSDTFTGSASNDLIIGGTGADSIDGGTGTDTFSAQGMNTAQPDGGVSDSVGAVVNLGSTTLTAADISNLTGKFTSLGLGDVASGQAAYLASSLAASVGLASTVDTLANIENVIGSGGTDYIVGSSVSNTIDGGLGADTLTGGLGVDTFVQGLESSVPLTALGVNNPLVAGNVVVFTNGLDVITDFAAGVGGDRLDIQPGAVTSLLGGVDPANLTASTNNYFVSGFWNTNTKVFTFAADGVGTDTLIIQAAGGANDVLATNTTAVLLRGVDSDNLVAGNFI